MRYVRIENKLLKKTPLQEFIFFREKHAWAAKTTIITELPPPFKSLILYRKTRMSNEDYYHHRVTTTLQEFIFIEKTRLRAGNAKNRGSNVIKKRGK